jgi:hypothetical protein
MLCSCVTAGKFEFFIEEMCDKSYYTDFSIWEDGEDYEIPVTYKVIVNDSTEKVAELDIFTHKPNLIELKDGVYEICFESCGIKYTRTMAIIPTLICCLDRYKTQYDYDREKSLLLESYIDFIKTNAQFNHTRIAAEYFIKAKALIKRLNCDCQLNK